MKITYAEQTHELEALKIKLIDSVLATNVLILSAHSGDEVLGCGGLIAHLSETASHIKVVCFSDRLEFEDGLKQDAEMKRIQEKEAALGLRTLGIHEISFLRLKEISAHQNIALKILEELKTREWDLMICPAKEDWNLEHRVINSSLQTALKYKLHYQPKILEYGLLGVQKPEVLFNIDEYLGAKEEAIRCHKSLLKDRDLLGGVLGLNGYFGKITGTCAHAEGYHIG